MFIKLIQGGLITNPFLLKKLQDRSLLLKTPFQIQGPEATELELT